MPNSTVLLDSDDLTVLDATCQWPAGAGREEGVDPFHVMLPRPSAFRDRPTS